MQLTALAESLDRLRVEYHALASQSQSMVLTATVWTIREDLTQLMQRQGNASRLLLCTPINVEEALTRVNRCLKRLDVTFNAHTTATGTIEIYAKQPTAVEARSKKSKKSHRKSWQPVQRSDLDDSKDPENYSSILAESEEVLS